MIDARFVPLEKWPGEPTKSRIGAPFRTTYAKTLVLLDRELRQLSAKNITIRAFFRANQLRQDGWPLSGSRPSQPGIVVSFTKVTTAAKEPLSFPCDRFTTFEDNMRAVALSLEALRAVDRYGVTRRAEQYQGWKQIAAPSDQPFSSKEEAAAFVCTQAYGDGRMAQQVLTNPTFFEAAYRSACRTMHPDSPTGSHELFVKLQAAKRLLEST